MATLTTPSTRARGPMHLSGLRPFSLGAISLGDCSPLDTACVEAEFEASVAHNAAVATANNRIYRANCSHDPFRTPESCYAQYPDVTPADLWAGNAPGGGGAMPYAPTTPLITNTPFTPITYQPPAQTQQPPINPVAATATFSNVTHPGQQSQVGDQWKVLITGTPGGVVSASSTKNGTSNGTATMGQLDATGRLTLTGAFAAGDVGNWTENWYVNGAPAGNFSFVVSAATPTTVTVPSTTGGGTGTPNEGGSGSGSGSGSNAGATDSSGGLLAGISTNTLLIGGAAIVALLLFKK